MEGWRLVCSWNGHEGRSKRKGDYDESLADWPRKQEDSLSAAGLSTLGQWLQVGKGDVRGPFSQPNPPYSPFPPQLPDSCPRTSPSTSNPEPFLGHAKPSPFLSR